MPPSWNTGLSRLSTTTMGHKSPSSLIVYAIAALIMLAAVSPSLIALSDALVPLVIAVGIVLVVARLVYFHTRRW